MSSLEQVQPITKKWKAELDAEVDDIIDRSLLDGTPALAMKFGRDLMATGHARALQMARLFYMLDKRWEQFETDDAVEDTVFKDMGVPVERFERYRDFYKHVLMPYPQLASKPIGGLIAITPAMREGDFNEEHIRQLELAPDRRTMEDIRNAARGLQTSGHKRLVITWDRNGHLAFREGDGDTYREGYLPRETGIEVIDKGVDRIVRASGVVKL